MPEAAISLARRPYLFREPARGCSDRRVRSDCRHGRARSIQTVVDAHGPALLAALGARPTVVKLNAAEAAERAALTKAIDGI